MKSLIDKDLEQALKNLELASQSQSMDKSLDTIDILVKAKTALSNDEYHQKDFDIRSRELDIRAAETYIKSEQVKVEDKKSKRDFIIKMTKNITVILGIGIGWYMDSKGVIQSPWAKETWRLGNFGN